MTVFTGEQVSLTNKLFLVSAIHRVPSWDLPEAEVEHQNLSGRSIGQKELESDERSFFIIVV